LEGECSSLPPAGHPNYNGHFRPREQGKRMTSSAQNQVIANVRGQRQAGRIVAATIQKDGRVPVIILSVTRPCFADYGAFQDKSYTKYPQSTCLIY